MLASCKCSFCIIIYFGLLTLFVLFFVQVRLLVFGDALSRKKECVYIIVVVIKKVML